MSRRLRTIRSHFRSGPEKVVDSPKELLRARRGLSGIAQIGGDNEMEK
jgi:hypothetical protein